MKVWGIDVGTLMGWAILVDGAAQQAGSWDLSGDPFDGFGMRPLRAGLRLDGLLAEHGAPAFVAIELPRRHAGTHAAHVWGALAGAVAGWCERNGIPYRQVGVGRAKLELAGDGAAGKAAMLAAVTRLWGLDLAGDEDAADACGIALAAWREETGQRSETAAERAKREARGRAEAKRVASAAKRAAADAEKRAGVPVWVQRG